MKKAKLYQQTLVAIASILTIVCILIVPVNASSDTTAPQINGFSISKSSINAPDKVQITVNIADEGSGVKWVKVFYYNPSKTQQLCANLSETSSGIWQGNLEFDRYAEEGTYTLWEIIAADVAGNQVDIYDTKLPAEYANKKITVSNAINSDTTAPQIKGFSISKNSINAPDKVQITVNIADEGSGVKWVKVFYYNPSKTQQLCANLSETSSGIWQGNLEFDRYAEEGTYTLWEIIAADVAGNQVDIYDTKLPAEYANKKITVSNVTNSTTGNQGSETTKPSTGSQGSEAIDPTTGNQGSGNTAPTTDNQSDEITDSTDDNNDQLALYIGLCITLAIVITCSIVVIVLKRKNKCRGNS